MLALAVLCASARAEVKSVEEAPVRVTFSYDVNPPPAANSEPPYSNELLTIQRAGQTVFEGAPASSICPRVEYPCWVTDSSPVRVLSLDGAVEPEVLLSLYTGGAHCCSVVQVLHYEPSTGSYSSVTQNFGDAGFLIQTLDGQLVFRSADARFDYRYTANAYSGLPLQYWSYSPAGFADVTKSFPAQVRSDARSWWHRYMAIRDQHTGYELGFIAAWAADEYRLGHARRANRIMLGEAAHHRLNGLGGLRRYAFVRNLMHVLPALGY
ncbi:MAG TPA: hypothetical protein VII01_05010 [Solirubrobacteraceae bacterium]